MPQHSFITEQKRLQGHYKALPADFQRILQVCAVLYEPVLQTQIQSLLQIMRWKGSNGLLLMRHMAKPLREELLGKDLLQREKNSLYCNRLITEQLIRQTVREGTFEEIATSAEKICPSKGSRPSYYEPAPVTIQRQLRLAFYRNDVPETMRLLAHSDPFKPMGSSQIRPLLDICALPLDPDWFRTVPVEFQFQVLTAMLKAFSVDLNDGRAHWEFMNQLLKPLAQENEAIACALAEIMLLRGEIEGVADLLKNGQSFQSLALQSWYYFFIGQDDLAVEYFTLSLKAKRKELNKRNVCIEGLASVFYVLALLRKGGATNRQLAQKYIVLHGKHCQQTSRGYLHIILDVCIEILEGISQCTSIPTENNTRNFDLECYRPLFSALVYYWTGCKPPRELLTPLMKFSQRASDTGWNWFATQSRLVLRALGEKLPEPSPLKDITPLTLVIKPEAHWERALRTLKELPGKSPDAQETSDSDRRMTWRICPSRTMLEPREQKQTKRGGWSAGRVVSLKKLHETPDDYEYLTQQDHQICRCIDVEHISEGWGGYSRAEYSLDNGTALKAAIGHPLLFLADEPRTALELIKGEPVLEVHKEKKGLRLLLTPENKYMTDNILVQDGPHRLKLVQFTRQHEHIADLLGENGLKVPLQAKEQVLETISAMAPLLTVHSDIGGGSHGDAEAVEADSRLHIQLHPEGGGLKMECAVRPFGESGPSFHPGEGGNTLFAEIDGKHLQTTRNQEQERQATDDLFNQCPALSPDDDWLWHLGDPEDALGTLQRLQQMDELVLEWPQGKQIKLSREATVGQMQVSMRQQQDWFGMQGELQVDSDRVIDMSKLLKLLEQSSGRFIKLAEGEFLALTDELRKRLDAMRAYGDKGKFHPLSAPILDEVTEGMQVKSSKEWRDQLKRLNEAQALQPKIPSTLQAELRDYQIEGFKWMSRLAHWGAGACLADDMGLGKTLQALALILTRATRGPTLILAPTSVCMNWMSEAERFAPTLKPLHFGPGDRQQMLDEAGAFDLIVCSYGLLQTETERLASVQWHTIVADEAQAIKNSQTKRSQAAMALQADYRIITTGTPIENHLGELWNLFRFINPGLLGSLEKFNRRFAGPIESNNDLGAKQRLRMLIHPFILRRLKSEVLAELPPKTEITLQVELGEEERVFYEAMRRVAMEKIADTADHPGQQRVKVLTEIMKLRRTCCNPRLVMPDSQLSSAKLQAFIEVIDELRENRHKALVFSQFVGHLGLLREHLDQQNINYQYLDGSTPVKQRKKAVDAFQAGDGDLFLISLKAGGSGLNLTAADYVIHMDPWWNPAVEDQASDRAHRMGQQRPVTIYRLVAKDTIEEQIVKLHSKKRDLADSLLEGSEMTGKISTEEMMALIREVGD